MRIKRCGFCGLARHGTSRGYQRCIMRAVRLARELIPPADRIEAAPGGIDLKAYHEDEGDAGASRIGFTYRPGLAAGRERGHLEVWREPAFPGQSVPGSDAAGHEGREPLAAEQAGRFGPRQEPR